MYVTTEKSEILTPRLAFKPFRYQWAYDYWFNQQNAHWMFQEINMQKDISDWKNEYLPECIKCNKIKDCGGHFKWNLKKHSDYIKPFTI